MRSSSDAAAMRLELARDRSPHRRRFDLVYLGEGAANIVYKINHVDPDHPDGPPPPPTAKVAASSTSAPTVQFSAADPHPVVRGKLLRISKVSTIITDTAPTTNGHHHHHHHHRDSSPHATNGSSSAPPAKFKGQLHFYETVVKARFNPQNIIKLEPVVICPDVIAALNAQLAVLEKEKISRAGSRIPQLLPEAFLINDMTSRPSESFSLEVKPKWLAQSPSAPPDAARCRTCALKAYRQRAGAAQGFCPLKLMTGDLELIKPIVETSIKNDPFKGDAENFYSRSKREQDHLLQQVAAFFSAGGKGHALLRTLFKYQQEFDPKGVLAVLDHAEPVESLCKAMTFRDCSLFVRVYWDGREIEARLGDLDPKMSTKVESWAATEKELLEGGWYYGKDADSDCLLAR